MAVSVELDVETWYAPPQVPGAPSASDAIEAIATAAPAEMDEGWLLQHAARRFLSGRRRAEAPGDQDDRGRFTAADVDRLIQGAWRRTAAAPWRSPAHIKLAVFEALVEDGVERGYAMDLTRELFSRLSKP